MYVVKSVPAGQPFVVSVRRDRRLLLIGALALPPFGAGAAALLVLQGDLLRGDPVMDRPFYTIFFCMGLLMVVAAMAVGYQFWRLRRPLPVLAASPLGVWFDSGVMTGDYVHLRWEEIERIHSRYSVRLERMLVVTAKDRSATVSRGPLLSGPEFSINLRMTDKSQPEIMAALAWCSAGRCLIG